MRRIGVGVPLHQLLRPRPVHGLAPFHLYNNTGGPDLSIPRKTSCAWDAAGGTRPILLRLCTAKKRRGKSRAAACRTRFSTASAGNRRGGACPRPRAATRAAPTRERKASGRVRMNTAGAGVHTRPEAGASRHKNLRKQRKGTHMRHMIFGESHGPAIGVVLEGVPAGLELDLEAVQRELDRRKPGQDPTATARRESDTVQVLSGVFEGQDHRRAAGHAHSQLRPALPGL